MADKMTVEEWFASDVGVGRKELSSNIIPTPGEIDEVVFDMIAAEAAQVPDSGSLRDLWSSIAFDPAGELQGYCFGHTPSEARAAAWITVWWPECELRAVPRTVPEGWKFETYPPGVEVVFETL